MPQESAARESQSRRVLCTPYNHAPCHFMQSHIRKVYACLAVTCHLRFWQNDRGLLRATAVTRGWNGYRNKSQHRKFQFSRRSSRDSNPRPFDHESGALTTELCPLPYIEMYDFVTETKSILFSFFKTIIIEVCYCFGVTIYCYNPEVLLSG